jgi:hypothetical protein
MFLAYGHPEGGRQGESLYRRLVPSTTRMPSHQRPPRKSGQRSETSITLRRQQSRMETNSFEDCGQERRLLSVHHYYGESEMKGDVHNLPACPLHNGRFYRQMQQMIRDLVPGRDIKLAVNGWNTSLPLPQQHSMESALYAARLMNVFERSGDLVQGKAVPTFDAVVSRSMDRRQIYIKAVNTDPSNAITTKVSVAGSSVSRQARVETLNSDSLSTSNDFSQPDSVHVSTRQIETGPAFMVTFPEHSVSVITLEVER